MNSNLDYIEHDGIRYAVTYNVTGKPFCYASATIKGRLIKGCGDDAQTAFWDLEQEIYQTFELPNLTRGAIKR